MRSVTIFILTSVALLSIQCQQKSSDVQVLNVKEFKMKTEDSESVILDVRTKGEVDQGIIKDAKHLDFYRDDFKTQVLDLDKKATYLIYCGSGIRSNKAAQWMVQNGFSSVFDLKGGIGAWKSAGEPIN